MKPFVAAGLALLLAAPGLAVPPRSLSDFTAPELVKHLQLQPLAEEGGFFRQIYLSSLAVEDAALRPTGPGQKHPLGTVIYFLMTPDAFSALHRLATDETLIHVAGDPVETLILFPDGTSRELVIGPDLARGQLLNFTVPAGCWQGHSIMIGGPHGYALFNAIMTPGFTWSDFEVGNLDSLLQTYPTAPAPRIRSLVRPEPALGLR